MNILVVKCSDVICIFSIVCIKYCLGFFNVCKYLFDYSIYEFIILKECMVYVFVRLWNRCIEKILIFLVLFFWCYSN